MTQISQTNSRVADFIQKRPGTAKVIASLFLATLLIGVAALLWREISRGHILKIAVMGTIVSIAAWKAGWKTYRDAKDPKRGTSF